MRKLAGLAGAIALAAAVGAGSSPGSSISATAPATPKSGTETITATLTGAPAASYFSSGGATPRTGTFAGATGGGTYLTTVVVGADLQPGRTTCSVSNAGTVIAKGTSITYRASGPLTVKQ